MNNAATTVRVSKWALVETATAGRWQVVNTETGTRSIPMLKDAAMRVLSALVD